MTKAITFLRYPGGKQRQLDLFYHLLPSATSIQGRYVEPFVGGGAVFFRVAPRQAILSDVNAELIDLYKGVKSAPLQVWEFYASFPATKKGYYRIRDAPYAHKDLAYRAARLLYINRTCFKGMWRHNADGNFNVGYGGQARRWVINVENLLDVSRRLENVQLYCCDYVDAISRCHSGDFMFLDPPYRPGQNELHHAHYNQSRFTMVEQQRLADELAKATKRGVKWAMTNSNHPDIVELYSTLNNVMLPKGTGAKIGHITSESGEVFIWNY